MKILKTKIISRDQDSTDITVECEHEGIKYNVKTTIREGRDDAGTTLVDGNPLPSAEFEEAFYEALDQTPVTEKEMNRICG